MQATEASQRRHVRRIGRTDDWLNIRVSHELRSRLAELAERNGHNSVSAFARAVLATSVGHKAS